MSGINISINPSYLCNFSCNFCYLTKQQLRDTRRAPLGEIKDRLIEVVNAGYVINQIDLYGGEIAALPGDYVEELIAICKKFTTQPVNIITNLSIKSKIFQKEDITLSVSYDFELREQSDIVLQNIISLSREVSVLILASEKLLKKDVAQMINTLNSLTNVISVELKPYSQNQSNQHAVSDKQFEEYVKKWISCGIKKRFIFVNESHIRFALAGRKNTFSNDHVYITPNAKFAVLEFDKDSREFFLELDSIHSYRKWSEEEIIKVKSNNFCKDCSHLGTCLTEHYREVTSLEKSCNGYKDLLDWYALNFQLKA